MTTYAWSSGNNSFASSRSSLNSRAMQNFSRSIAVSREACVARCGGARGQACAPPPSLKLCCQFSSLNCVSHEGASLVKVGLRIYYYSSLNCVSHEGASKVKVDHLNTPWKNRVNKCFCDDNSKFCQLQG